MFLVQLLLLLGFATAVSIDKNSNDNDRRSRGLFFFMSDTATDDRHNPNINLRNTTNPPGLPVYTVKPTRKPSKRPTRKPTSSPTKWPSAKPTVRPSVKPSRRPSRRPTAKPSTKPTARPSSKPTARPTKKPTSRPSARPTTRPSRKPTARPTVKPTARPSSKPSARPSAKPTRRPTGSPTKKPISGPTSKPSPKPTSRPSSKPTARPSAKPTRRPTGSPTKKPISGPTSKPSPKPTSRPSNKPSPRPTSRPSNKPIPRPTSQPSKRPSKRPTTKPSRRPTSKYTFRPSRIPSLTPSKKPVASPTKRPTKVPTQRPSKRPINPPTRKPTRLPTIRPSQYPTRSPTTSPCSGKHYGNFGNTSSNNFMSVPYNYELVSNNTQMLYEYLDLSSVVTDVEYAITDFLLKNLFSECASYYSATHGGTIRQLRRQLTSGQVIGISSQPKDIITDGTCNVTDELSSSSNIFASTPDPAQSCTVLKGRLTLYVDDVLFQDISGLESLFIWVRSLIKGGMESGQIALLADEAVIKLRYLEDTEKLIAPVAAVFVPNESNKKVLWSLIALAALLLLLALLAAARLFKRRKKKEEVKAFHTLADDKDIVTVKAYDFDGFSDLSSARNSNQSIIPPPMNESKKKAVAMSRQFTNVPTQHIRKLTPLDIEGLEDFLDNRFGSDEDELVVPKIVPAVFIPPDDRSMKSDYGSRGVKENVSLKHVNLNPSKPPKLDLDDEQDYTYEAMGTNRGITPKCSICYKDADGWMRSCQCGNRSCDKIAHSVCIDGRYPTPSVSYPGTPPPSLPPILCGSENISWLNRSRSHSQNYDEENRIVSSLSRSHSSDDDSVSDALMRNRSLSCMSCRE